jgi:hypothetical protein
MCHLVQAGMQKPSKNKVRRKQPTVTFQPDPDILEGLIKLIPSDRRGERTRLVNQALREGLPLAAEKRRRIRALEQPGDGAKTEGLH